MGGKVFNFNAKAVTGCHGGLFAQGNLPVGYLEVTWLPLNLLEDGLGNAMDPGLRQESEEDMEEKRYEIEILDLSVEYKTESGQNPLNKNFVYCGGKMKNL